MTNWTTIRPDTAAPRAASSAARWTPDRRTDLVGYTVGVVGGCVGTVDPATADADPEDLVIRTRRRGFCRKVVVPAGAINCVDHESRCICLQGDREMVNNAPHLDPSRRATSHHRWYQSRREAVE